MARRVDDEIGRVPKKRDPAHGRSAGASQDPGVLARVRQRAFAEVLASMPDVGVDADFERIDSVDHSADPFSVS